MNDIKLTIETNESELNSLFKEVLDGLRDDVVEAQDNVDLYFEVLAVDGGKELYGGLYNDSLKIKGSARDRQLKFLNVFKERVSKKEANELSKQPPGFGGIAIDHTSINTLMDDLKKGGDLDKIDLTFDDDDDE